MWNTKSIINYWLKYNCQPKLTTFFVYTALKWNDRHVSSWERSPCVSLWVCTKPLQSCQTFCNPMDGSPPGSSVCRIFQARILEWVTLPPSRGLSDPGIELRLLCLLHWQVGSLPLVPSGNSGIWLVLMQSHCNANTIFMVAQGLYMPLLKSCVIVDLSFTFYMIWIIWYDILYDIICGGWYNLRDLPKSYTLNTMTLDENKK